jgi:hypothetical protein
MTQQEFATQFPLHKGLTPEARQVLERLPVHQYSTGTAIWELEDGGVAAHVSGEGYYDLVKKVVVVEWREIKSNILVASERE